MALDIKEDHSAPISEKEILDAKTNFPKEGKLHVVNRILDYLNEKRDAYYGIVSSIIHIIDSQDEDMNNALQNGLIKSITSFPMRFSGKMLISKALDRLTNERPLFVIELFEAIIENTIQWSLNFNDESEILRVQIISLKAIHQAGQIEGGRETKLSQDQIDELCDKAIRGCDDSTKIDTLSLVLASRSTTKPLNDKELNHFKTLFRDALSLQAPAHRQIFLAQTNKLIKRLKDSHRVVKRDQKLYSQEQRDSIGQSYREFLKWLIEFCFNSIYCNAYFGSFILTISTLKIIIKQITFFDRDLVIESYFNQKRCFDSILSCLNDSFDENKALALDLLLSLPYNDQFFSEENLVSLEKIAYQLVESVNPAHSLTCQYIFKLIVGLRKKQAAPKTITTNQLLHKHLCNLVNIVEEGVKETQEDFVVALKNKPIYPKLTCIRALLNDIDIKDLESNRENWKKLAKRIVANSIEACKAVSTIVCNLNPETIGHLPMDLKPVDAETLSKTLKISLKISDSKLNTITSQMLLISGWKTIKECSLSLGAMCIRFWWPKGGIKMKLEKFPGLKSEAILDSSDIIKIIDFFDHYLRNLRHRGAFEQAYNGFIMVTRRVWHDEQFRNLLIGTLQQIMGDFKSDAIDVEKKECLKAYVTRRSAGLPFIIQAILNSEERHDSKTLRWVLDSLFEVLESENSELYQRIHCLNILRALIKEHFLGEKVLSYVGKTFAITLESFESDSFPIRNCANMLLKANVDRTFGVNRLRDDIHRKNQLSFERFFTECPDLHEKMLGHLKRGLIDKKSLATVHAVFIILFRLKPSLKPSNDFQADKIIKPFIEPILELALTCPDYKLRELAAKLAVKLENFCSQSEQNANNSYCEQDIQSYRLLQLQDIIFRVPQTIDRNRIHGALLLTKNWVETYANCSTSLDNKRRSIFLSFAKRVVQEICLADRKDTNSSLKLVALNLAESCCLTSPTSDNRWIMNLNSFFELEENSLKTRTFIEPQFEGLVFKFLTVSLMTTFSQNGDNMLQQVDHVREQVVEMITKIIRMEPNHQLGINLQASLIRFLRQVLNGSNEFVDSLLEMLDVDSTAAYVTPFDKLDSKSEHDSEREILTRYCQQDRLKHYLTQNESIRQIFSFSDYKEFKTIDDDGNLKFSPKFSNSLRSVELLVLACKSWDEFNLGANITWFKKGETRIEKLHFLTKFVSTLPDCDVKCLALLCAGKIMAAEIHDLFTESKVLDENEIEILNNLSQVIDELTDGDSSLTTRETCSEVLRLNMLGIVAKRCAFLQKCLMNLFSALIKLSQDEEQVIRLSSQKVILSLKVKGLSATDSMVSSRLEHLIRLITLQSFDPNIQKEMENCTELLLRIIFNHSKNYSNNLGEGKERLFDKTKLNTFADHVATIESALEGLQMFFERRNDTSKISISSLSLHESILLELTAIDSTKIDDTGDYSWRLKRVIDSSPATDTHTQDLCKIDRFLENLLESLQYFSSGYWKMLTDTEYTYHELSLYKRVAFARFTIQCTVYNPKEYRLIEEIKRTLGDIVTTSCSTTLLCKCLELLNYSK